MGEDSVISLVSGPPGCGKTYGALRAIATALRKDQWVATNVSVDVEAIGEYVWRSKGVGFRIANDKDLFLERLRASVIEVETVGELDALVLPGSGESRGLAVLDEAQTFLNARMWKDEGRSEAVRFFTQHRKRGWDVLLISQFTEAIDRQVRSLAETDVMLRNAKNFRVGGIKIFPGNVFIAQHQWAGHQRLVIKREWYRLDRTLAKCYDTHQIVATGEGDPNLLSRPDGAKRRRRSLRPRSVPGSDPRPRSPFDPDEVMQFDPKTGDPL